MFSTGFGNPPPSTVIGFIYIEMESFAIVKFDLMSEDSNTEMISVIKRKIDRLKLDVKVNEDVDYWNHNNIILAN